MRIGGPLAGVVATYGVWELSDFWPPDLLVTLTAVPSRIGLAILTDYLYFTSVVTPARGGATGGLAVAF